MSEFEQTSGPAKNTGLWIAVICVVVVGGCLLVCAGLAAVGLVVPAVMRQERQAEQAARNAEQIAKAQATAKARAAQPATAEADDRPENKETAEPAAEDAPAKDFPRVEEEGAQSKQTSEP